MEVSCTHACGNKGSKGGTLGKLGGWQCWEEISLNSQRHRDAACKEQCVSSTEANYTRLVMQAGAYKMTS